MSKLAHFSMMINGQACEGSEGQVLPSINPATGEVWATFACASRADVARAVAGARAALRNPAWANMLPSARARLIDHLADLVESHAHALGEIETRDSGKLLAETVTQTRYVAEYYRYFAGLADKIEGATLPIDKPDMHVFTLREPIGVVAAIVPWNAQMFLTATKVGPALAAGCTIVLKASEVAPCAMYRFAELVKRAGIPDGVVSVICGDAENCAVPLTSHPDIDRLAFTGGPETARKIVHNTAENLAVTSLELGGKSPILIFEDADLVSAANGAIAGNFGASGQSCVAGSRVLVQRTILPQFLKRITRQARQIKVGDPLDGATHVGPLCTKNQINHIMSVLEKSKSQGAEILFGGDIVAELLSGHYMQPTLVLCPDTQIASMTTELFGPIMSVIGFDHEAEAVAMANDTRFGLGAGVFTRDLARAHRVVKQVRSGICWVNTYRAISPIAPFGGFDQSGYGREAGLESVLDYTRTKTVWINLSDTPMANPFVMR